jgi:hypothetical protein
MVQFPLVSGALGWALQFRSLAALSMLVFYLKNANAAASVAQS